MWLLWFAVALLLLRLFEVRFFATISWWWVAAPFVAAFLWFEFIEPRLGLQQKKAMDEMDESRKERIRRTMERPKGR